MQRLNRIRAQLMHIHLLDIEIRRRDLLLDLGKIPSHIRQAPLDEIALPFTVVDQPLGARLPLGAICLEGFLNRVLLPRDSGIR